MARQARKNTNLVENVKEINYRFHTLMKEENISRKTQFVMGNLPVGCLFTYHCAS